MLAVVAAVAGTTLAGVVTQGKNRAEEPDAPKGAASTPTTKAPATQRVRGPVLDKSAPVAIRIKAVKLRSRLLALGLQRDGTVQVPPPKKADRAGWYESSPTPGEPGPAVVIGHKDRAKGMPAPVFANLGRIRRGNIVEIARADKMVAVFRVDRVVRYPATHFPSDEVYGSVDHAGLRLITATAGDSQPRAGEKNVVVYASLVKGRAAG